MKIRFAIFVTIDGAISSFLQSKLSHAETANYSYLAAQHVLLISMSSQDAVNSACASTAAFTQLKASKEIVLET